MVEKLEVVNKKWVRIRLSPGNATDATVLFFNVLNRFSDMYFMYYFSIYREHFGLQSVALIRLNEI